MSEIKARIRRMAKTAPDIDERLKEGEGGKEVDGFHGHGLGVGYRWRQARF